MLISERDLSAADSKTWAITLGIHGVICGPGLKNVGKRLFYLQIHVFPTDMLTSGFKIRIIVV
jgi:hypothetical protein